MSWSSCKFRGRAKTAKEKGNAGIFHRTLGMQRNQEASWRIAPSSNQNTALQLTNAFLFGVFTLNLNYEYVSSEPQFCSKEEIKPSESIIQFSAS